MEAKLVKVNDAYSIIIDGKHVAFANESLLKYASQEFRDNLLGELSLKNCQAIEHGYDLDELIDSFSREGSWQCPESFKEGFLKALQITNNNKELLDFIRDCAKNWDCDSDAHKYNTTCRSCEARKLLKSLQQTEWDVEIKSNIDNYIEGNLNYDQTGRAYPDNPEKNKNWKAIWKYEDKFYKLVGDDQHKQWEEVKPKFKLDKNKCLILSKL